MHYANTSGTSFPADATNITYTGIAGGDKLHFTIGAPSPPTPPVPAPPPAGPPHPPLAKVVGDALVLGGFRVKRSGGAGSVNAHLKYTPCADYPTCSTGADATTSDFLTFQAP